MTKLERAIQRAFDKCNLIGETVDIYEVLYSYKTIAQLPDEEIDKIYDTIAEGLGFTKRKIQPGHLKRTARNTAQTEITDLKRRTN